MFIFRGKTKQNNKIYVMEANGNDTAKGSLYSSLRITLLIFRGLGLFPVIGLTNNTGDGLR